MSNLPEDVDQDVSQFSIGDPDPLPDDATDEMRRTWLKLVFEYSTEMYESFRQSSLVGEDLWLDFTSTFREHTIMNLSPRVQKAWVELLCAGGVYVKRRRGYPRSKSLIECIQQNEFIPITAPQGTAMANQNRYNLRSLRNQTANLAENESSNHRDTENDEAPAISSNIVETIYNANEFNSRPLPAPNESHDRNTIVNTASHVRRSTGITGLIRAFSGRKQFGGSFDEDLSTTLELYETLSRMCRLDETEKAEGIPVMLKEDALSFYMSTTNPGDTFEVVIQRFSDHYMTPEQRNRALVLWQSLRLSVLMRETPSKSELEVFRELVTRLSHQQKQLSESYRKDEFLRDQIVIASDSYKIQQSMRERVPATAADARNRIATFLSSERSSAGAFTVSHGGSPDEYAMYSSGYKYGGQARKRIKSYNRQSSSLSKWLAGHKGCFVCKKEHRARDHHTREEVSKAIKKLKEKYPKALLSIDDFVMIIDDVVSCPDTTLQNEDESSSSSESEVNDDTAFVIQEARISEKKAEIFLANSAFIHGNTFESDLHQALNTMYTNLQEGENSNFNGLYIDTCANRSSVMSYGQYRAYCDEFKVPERLQMNNVRNLRGIGGTSKPLGTALIPVPFIDLGISIDVQFQIVRENVPSLLSMKDMVENELDISLLDREIKFKNRTQSLEMKNYFLIHKWKRCDVAFSLFTEIELKKLHRAFGHPSVTALVNLLRRARPNQMTKEVQNTLSEITKACLHCSAHSSKPKRFKLTIGADDLQYNHIVAVDIMYIRNRPVIHIVDEATHYSAAQFLTKVSTEKVWKAIVRLWMRTYLGPPDFLRVDQGSQFVSKEFFESAEADGITVLPAPIESPSTMTHVERYHGPLRTAFIKIRESLPRSETDQDCLLMAVKSVNDTIGPEGLCPTLLVYGTIPKPARNRPADSQLARAAAIEKAMKAVQKDQSKRRIAFGLKTKGVPIGRESSSDLRKLPAGSSVLVYRNKIKKWEGPFKFIQVDGETAIVQLPHGRKIFRSNVVKPVTQSAMNESRNFKAEKSQVDQPKFDKTYEDSLPHDLVNLIFAEGMEIGSFITTVIKPNIDHTFVEARENEIKGLMDRGTFEVLEESSVPIGERIYGSRWVDALKTVNKETYEKSRLVAQNYRDEGATTIATKSPTVSRLGLRTTVCLAAMKKSMTTYLRDITQAYTQSEFPLERDIYLRAPPEMKLEAGKVLKARRPLYGIPESGLLWFLTYTKRHKNDLAMTATKYDPCVFFKRSDSKLEGVTVLQVDDSLGFGSVSFLEDENSAMSKFKSKPRTILKPGEESEFNGFTLKFNSDGSYSLTQSGKLSELRSVSSSDQFVSQRAKAQYIGVCTRPDICASVQLLASATEPDESDYKQLNKIIKRCNDTAEVGLRYVPLDDNNIRLLLFTDSSFANAKNLKSQIGFVLAIADKHDRANIIHYGSSRCKRVTRSVLAAEIHGLIYGYDNAFVVKNMLEEIMGKKIKLSAVVDSRTLFNVIVKNSSTLEKRLQIDSHALRESLDNGEIENISWIPGDANPSDGMTKGIVLDKHPLWKLMHLNKIDIKPTGWMKATKLRPEN